MLSSSTVARTKIPAVRHAGQVPVTEEADVFEALGLAYRPPERREQLGEMASHGGSHLWLLNSFRSFLTPLDACSDRIPTWREETRKGLESPWEHPGLPLCPFWGWTTASCDLYRRASQVGRLWSDKRVRCCAARIQFYSFPCFFQWHWQPLVTNYSSL